MDKRFAHDVIEALGGEVYEVCYWLIKDYGYTIEKLDSIFSLYFEELEDIYKWFKDDDDSQNAERIKNYVLEVYQDDEYKTLALSWR